MNGLYEVSYGALPADKLSGWRFEINDGMPRQKVLTAILTKLYDNSTVS